MIVYSDAGRPVVKGGQNMPLLVGIGLTDLPNIGGQTLPPPPTPPFPASLVYTRELTFSFIRDYCIVYGTIHLGRPQVGEGEVSNFIEIC